MVEDCVGHPLITADVADVARMERSEIRERPRITCGLRGAKRNPERPHFMRATTCCTPGSIEHWNFDPHQATANRVNGFTVIHLKLC